MKVRVKVEKIQVQKPWKNGLYTYDHDIVYVSTKRGGRYELKDTFEGPDYFDKLTALLRERGKKLAGGKNGWVEFYEVDKYDLDEALFILVGEHPPTIRR